mmetsp:Transcript_9881/g.25570  ORF Transcript_9881/g.25570 Transcript_9881/m.25570 type:complete len:267 (+) Transcript_9881:129-929(+)
MSLRFLALVVCFASSILLLEDIRPSSTSRVGAADLQQRALVLGDPMIQPSRIHTAMGDISFVVMVYWIVETITTIRDLDAFESEGWLRRLHAQVCACENSHDLVYDHWFCLLGSGVGEPLLHHRTAQEGLRLVHQEQEEACRARGRRCPAGRRVASVGLSGGVVPRLVQGTVAGSRRHGSRCAGDGEDQAMQALVGDGFVRCSGRSSTCRSSGKRGSRSTTSSGRPSTWPTSSGVDAMWRRWCSWCRTPRPRTTRASRTRRTCCEL